MDSGEQRLRQLGYKQELKRDLSVFSNFAFSFSIISVLTGVTTLYNTGLSYGGPISMTYGWLISGVFTLFVALSMAEICSAYPTSGGLYFWSYQLAGDDWGPLASWFTGWFNMVGQWALTTSVDYSLATLLQIMILLSTGGANGGGYLAPNYVVLGFYGCILFVHASLNCLPIKWLAKLGAFSAAWNIAGVFFLMIAIPLLSPTRATGQFVFGYFNTTNDYNIHSSAYVFLIGLLMSQYTVTGYDASAIMSEETKSSDKSGSYGIISAVAVSVVVGWGYVLGLNFSVTDIDWLLDSSNDANGYAVAQLFYDVFKERYGSGTGGIICLGIVAVAIFFCGMSSLTSNSRMAYAFSRDGAMPFSKIWYGAGNDEIPVKTVWLSAGIAFIMALTSLGSQVAFQAMVSIATIGLYIAYVLPTLLRITVARKRFVHGPFNLGSWGVGVGSISVCWVLTIAVLFSLPVEYPITLESLNYTPIAVGGVLVLVIGGWFGSARFWFKGPVPNLSDLPETDGLLAPLR